MKVRSSTLPTPGSATATTTTTTIITTTTNTHTYTHIHLYPVTMENPHEQTHNMLLARIITNMVRHITHLTKLTKKKHPTHFVMNTNTTFFPFRRI